VNRTLDRTHTEVDLIKKPVVTLHEGVAGIYRHCDVESLAEGQLLYRGADKSLARPGRKEANASVRMA